MTTRDMYNALLHDCRYKPDGYYPSNRYESCHDKQDSWWKPVNKDYAKIIKECLEKKDGNMDFNNTKILVDGREFKAHNIEVTSDYNGTVITASAHLTPTKITNSSPNKISEPLTITNVIFNPPATIVFWSDKTKTIVKADFDYEFYDPEKGIAMAIAKKLMGDNKGKYYDIFKYWRKKWDEQNKSPENPPMTNSPLNNLSEKIKSAFNIPSNIIIDDLVSPKENP